jgi:hypothetical protein
MARYVKDVNYSCVFLLQFHRKNPRSMRKKMISVLLACSVTLFSAAQPGPGGDWVGVNKRIPKMKR